MTPCILCYTDMKIIYKTAKGFGKECETVKSYIPKISDILFFIGIYIEIFLMCAATAGVNVPFSGRIFQLAALIFMGKILLTKYNRKENIAGGILLFLSLLQWYYAGNATFFYAVLMIYASKNVPYEKLLKSIFVILAAFMAGMVLLSSVGVIDGLTMVYDYGRGGIEMRYCFGFPHPNVFHSHFYRMISVFVLAYAEKLNVYVIAVIALLNIAVTFFTVSRTGMLIILILCMMLCVAIYLKPLASKKTTRIVGCMAIACACISSVIVLFWESPVTDKLDDMLTGRIRLARESAMPQTWTFLPNTIDRNVLDMGYVQMYATAGILLATVYMAVMILFYAKAWKLRDTVVMAVLLTYAIFMLVESHAGSIYFIGNIMYLSMIGRIFKSGSEAEGIEVNSMVDTENTNIVK